MATKNLKVLIVDDAETVNRRIRSLLKEVEGVTVVGEASNSSEALMITEIMNPDLILMDIDIPIINGMDTLKELKQRHRRTKVMIFTNYVDEPYRLRCMNAGADFFIDKSIECEKVSQTIISLTNSLN